MYEDQYEYGTKTDKDAHASQPNLRDMMTGFEKESSA